VDEPELIQREGSSENHLTACHFPLEKWSMSEEEVRRAPVGQQAPTPA
jgi:hypothetical protein